MTTRFLRAASAAICICLVAVAGPADEQFKFAEGLFINQDYQSAIEEYKSYLKEYPEGADAGIASFRIAESHFRLKRYKEAAEAYEAGLEQHPKSREAPLGSYNLARSYMELGEREKGLAAFQQAVKDGDEMIRQEAAIGIGETLMQLDRYAEAADHYDAFLKEFPDHKQQADVLFTIGFARYHAQQHQQAVAPLKKLLELEIGDAARKKAQVVLSDTYTELAQYNEATTLLQQMLEADPNDDTALIRLAWTQLKSGAETEAAKTFLDYTTRFPKQEFVAMALYNAGIIYYNTGQHQQAIDAFTRLREVRPESQEAKEMQLWLGTAAFQVKQFDMAVAELDKVLEAEALPAEQLAVASYTRAEALAGAEQHTSAITGFQKLIESWPESSYVNNAIYSKARAEHAIGKTADAVKSLNGLLERELRADLRSHTLFALGEYLFTLGKLEEAQPYLLELAKQGGGADPAHVAYRLGWTHFEQGQHAESRQVFEQLAGRPSRFQAEAIYLAGMSAERLDDKAGAIAAYEQLAGGDQDGEFVEKAMYRLAFLYSGDQARENLARYKERFPEGTWHAAMRLKIAEELLTEGKLAEAEVFYRELMGETLTDELAAMAWYGLGWSQLRQGKLTEANQSFAKVAAAKPESGTAIDAILQRGEIAYQREAYEEAARLFGAIKDANNAKGERALYMLGWCAVQQNDARAAEPWFRAVITRFPEGEFYADSAIRLASILKDSGRFDEALKVLEAAIPKAQPDLKETLNHLYSDLLVATKNWEKLLEVAEEMRQKWPDSRRVYLLAFRQGLAYKELGIHDKAEAAFRETIAKTDTIEAARAQFNIGTLYAAKADWLEAGKQFLRVEMLFDYDEVSPQALYHAIEAFVRAEGVGSPRVTPHLKKLRDRYKDSQWTERAEALMRSGAQAPAQEGP